MIYNVVGIHSTLKLNLRNVLIPFHKTIHFLTSVAFIVPLDLL